MSTHLSGADDLRFHFVQRASAGRVTFGPESEAVNIWLAAYEDADREVWAEFRNLSAADGPAPLARAMRQYVDGAVERARGGAHVLSPYGDNAIERVDFDAIATMTRDRVRKFARRDAGFWRLAA